MPEIDTTPPPPSTDDDGFEAAGPARAPRKPREPRVSREIPEGHVEITTTRKTRPAKDGEGGTPSVKRSEPQTPFDVAAAVESSAIEVERVGPGNGPGWSGRSYAGQQVPYVRMGKLPNGPNLLDDCQRRYGGGEYEFSGKDQNGKPSVFRKIFPGAPLPPDGVDPEAEAQAATEQNPNLYPYGYDSSFGIPTGTFGGQVIGGQPFVGPQGSFVGYRPQFEPPPGTPDAQGFIAPVEPDDGYVGWAFLHAVGKWKWCGKGPQPGPPPPLPGAAANQQQYNPGIYDHRGDAAADDRAGKLERLVEKVLEKIQNPPSNPMEGFVAMMQAQQAADRDRHEREHNEARLRFDQEKEDRREQRAREESAAKVQAEAQREVARLQAEAQKETAKYAHDTSAQNMKMMMETMKAANPLGAVRQLSEAVGMPLFGGNGKSETAEIATAVSDGIQAGAKGIADVLTVWKGRGGSSAGDLVGSSQEQDQFRFLAFVIDNMRSGVPPEIMPKNLAVAAKCFNLDIKETTSMIAMATPEVVCALIDKNFKDTKISDEQRAQIESMKATILTPEARAWLEGIKTALRGGVTALPAPGKN